MLFSRCVLLVSILMLSIFKASGTTEHDSLLYMLKTMPNDTTRLRVLNQLVTASDGDMEVGRSSCDMLMQEAERQDNNNYRCEAYMHRIIMAYNTYDSEALMAAFVQLEPLARKEKRYDLLFRGWRCKIDFLILSRDFEQNEKEAQRMLAEAESLNSNIGILEAYQCLGNIYRATFRLDKAIEVLEKARLMAIAEGNVRAVTNIWQAILFVYEERTDFEARYKSLLGFDAYLHANMSDKERRSSPIFVILYASFMKYYTHKSDWNSAEKYRLLSEQKLESVTSPLYAIYFYLICSDYYKQRDMHAEALNSVDMALEAMKRLSSEADYYSILRRKAEILYHMGRYDESLPLYKEVSIFQDSMHLATINKQYEQLKQDFNADQLLIEQAQLRLHMQIYILIFLSAVFLVVAYYVISQLRSRRLVRRAECEMMDMTRQLEEANEAKDRFLSNIGTSINIPLKAVVDGSLRLASHEVDEPVERQLLSKHIREISTGLLRTFNNILDLSRLEAGMMVFDTSETEIMSLMIDVAMNSEAAHNGVAINTNIPEDTLYMAHLDANRLSQVLRNLFLGVVDGGNQITVVVREEGMKLHIVISGTLLAQQSTVQNVIIRNEINRMLIEHFGGTYELYIHKKPQEVVILLPFTEVIRS